jgi:hypothetical protein
MIFGMKCVWIKGANKNMEGEELILYKRYILGLLGVEFRIAIDRNDK